MKILAVFVGLIFFGVALLAGGCSVFFVVSGDMVFGDPSIFTIWLSGFLLSAVAFWLGRRLMRYSES